MRKVILFCIGGVFSIAAHSVIAGAGGELVFSLDYGTLSISSDCSPSSQYTKCGPEKYKKSYPTKETTSTVTITDTDANKKACIINVKDTCPTMTGGQCSHRIDVDSVESKKGYTCSQTGKKDHLPLITLAKES